MVIRDTAWKGDVLKYREPIAKTGFCIEGEAFVAAIMGGILDDDMGQLNSIRQPCSSDFDVHRS